MYEIRKRRKITCHHVIIATIIRQALENTQRKIIIIYVDCAKVTAFESALGFDYVLCDFRGNR